MGVTLNKDRLTDYGISSYKNVGKIEQAERVFNQIQDPDIVSWTCLLNLYLHSDLPSKSLSTFSHCLYIGLRPDSFLIVAALSSCGQCRDLVRGKVVHGIMLRNCLDEKPVVGNALMDLLSRAREVFDAMPDRNLVSWMAMITRCVKGGAPIQASEMFKRMIANDGGTSLCPDLLAAVLSAYADVGALEFCYDHKRLGKKKRRILLQ
ncbi:hypothetical protein Fmac_015602 [Flemingia macrophylla]|uniref:Pentatricopeptide repeat-containing protein n=1 Tax=Flemingia macrophylla TaxID=520843 RepID=A0ABD1MF04_9FABA